MKTYGIISLAAFALILGACVPSVQPFYTTKDIVFDARLVGQWGSDDKETWKFEKSGTNSTFDLTVKDDRGKHGEFDATLFVLREKQFLDIFPNGRDILATNLHDLVAFSIIPGHLLFRVLQVEPKLKLAMMDPDFLEKHLGKNPTDLAHAKDGKTIYLTAETRDLQRFVSAHLDELFKISDGDKGVICLTNTVPGAASTELKP
jgi:hypothetical protein